MKNKTNTISLTIAILSLVLFIFITITFSNNLFSIDSSINSWVENNQISLITKTAKLISFIFEPTYLLVVILLCSLIIYLKKSKKQAIFISLISLIGGGLVYLIKNIIQRSRPLNSIIEETSFSFPSGHATIAILFFGCLTYLSIIYLKSKKSKRIIFSTSLVLVLLVGFSRIYLNVHWFSDVIAGFTLGLFLLLSIIILKKTKFLH